MSRAGGKTGRKILVLTTRWPYCATGDDPATHGDHSATDGDRSATCSDRSATDGDHSATDSDRPIIIGGDRLRIYAICRELSKRHAVTLLSLCASYAEMAMKLPDDGVFAAAHRVYLPKWKSWLNCAAALPGAAPLQVAYYRSAAFRRKVAALAPAHDFALAHLIRAAHYARDCGLPAALEMTDALALNYARVAEVGDGGWRSWIYRLERRRLQGYELRAASWFDLAVLCSAVDRDFLFPPPAPGNVLVCGNGVDVARVKFSPPDFGAADSDSPATVIFIGNMTTLQNLDAARWFCRRVLPLLRRQNSAWQFTIIGRMAARDMAKFNRIAGVIATGQVADVAAEVATVAEACGGVVGVCPVRIGAGVQNKILDCMAMGVPCVVSAVGAEGLRCRPGEHFLPADTPDEFAAACARIKATPAEGRRLAINARRYVEAQHAWPVNLAALVEGVEVLMGR